MNERELKVLCRAVGDVTRLRIVRHLTREPEVSVSDLADLLVLSQPLASWHLRILKRAGILATRKDGRQVYCSLDTRRIQQFQEAIGDLIRIQPGKEDVWEKSALPSSA
ncbi:MAG: helix-turn-helix transcriptional regulator [Chloroflexi bacterium]|nr:helix-turn-helix transcriptional regulator [Chloroflexota bacterium]